MLRSKKNALLHLLYFLLLNWRAESLKMTVQVTVVPSVTSILPLCGLPLLQSLQSLLTHWVTEATQAVVPDFNLPRPLRLTYFNPSRRLLRTTTTKSTKVSPQSCSTCSSSGCSTYCGRASCNRCSHSRRLEVSDILPGPSNLDHVAAQFSNETKDLQRELSVDFSSLGPQISLNVQSFARDFPLNNLLFDILGCLGNPLLLATNVTFIMNQVFYP